MRLLVRVGKALVVHGLLFLIAWGLIIWLGAGENALASAVRARFHTQPGYLEDLRAERVGNLVNWLILALTFSFVATAAWLARAESLSPIHDGDASRYKPGWVGAILLVVILCPIIGWIKIWHVGYSEDLSAPLLLDGRVIVELAVVLAFYLATATTVKRVMRPAVPLSFLLPHF